ncbi:hybrid sensor histidine kinase/response regulator [Lentisalinibacter orientalis]|uniref:hybrid sensor histidine kinase/response regulator n=1 Tax=Lentisalinibacter orientalis TaxID=2992241 RepID=UPI00386BC078
MVDIHLPDGEFFRLAFDLAPSPLVIVDEDGVIVLANEESERLFGYSRGELVGERAEALVPERLRPAGREPAERFLDTLAARNGSGDLCGLRRDGTEIPMEIGLKPLRIPQGTATVVSIADLTERRRAETYFQKAVDSSPSGMLMVNERGIITLANREVTRAFGYDEDELIGRSIETLVPERFGEAHPDHRRSYMASPEARPMGVGRELFGVRRDGTEVPVEVGLTPVTTAEGTFVLASVVDITMRRTMENQLREAQRLETIGGLASGIAHDFNNVLMAILGYAEMVLASADLGPESRADLDQIVRAAQRGRQVVERMLAVGRGRQGPPEPTRLHETVDEALELLKASLLKSVEMRVHLDETAPPVLCDSTQIHQIVMNLGTNAAKAMTRSDGVLDVSLVPYEADEEGRQQHPELQPGLYSRLTISDNGMGMPQAVAERIYEPFYTSSRTGEGTGLGLWLVREAVQALRGVIEVKTREGEGTTFDIFLPAAEQESAQDDAAPEDPRSVLMEHVVYVEDEEALARLGRRVLERAGYRVTVFTSSLEALERLRSRQAQPDLLVTDNTMPRLSGLELAGEAVRIRPGLPVLMVSGLAKMRLEDVPDFVTRVLPKPHSADELITAVDELLGRERG